MAPLAVLYKNMGWKVTGSDRAFFPPMSTYLENNGIKIMPGFKAEHLKESPDFVLAMAFVTGKNPEIVEAKKQKIPIKVYADVLPELIEKKNSIVITGDCGKTSTTALIAWILESAGLNPNFMIGGLPKNFEHGIRKTNSDWSVIEGDEYVASNWDTTSRFLYYNPKYLIITNIRWDHMDKFPTERKYIQNFEKIVERIPADGIIIANKDGENVEQAVRGANAPVIFYNEKSFKNFPAPFKGKIWRQNSAAAVALARHIKISDSQIKKAIKTFTGIRRRQEIRAKQKNIIVVDDNAHTPIKVAGGLEAISKMFPGYSLHVIYEPGNRSKAALRDEGYRKCFALASSIVLPRISSAREEVRDFNKKLAKLAGRYYKNLNYIEDDTEVLSEIKKTADKAANKNKRVAFVFMSQKGFRGMMEEAISLLQ